jgi:ABC-type lipoprotein release transport system permease subunit
MRRQVALLRFAVGSAGRRAGRTFSLGAALALVTLAFSSVLFLTEALRGEFRQGVAVLPDLTVQRLVGGRPSLIGESETAWIAELPGVIAVRPRVWGYFFVPSLAGNFTVVGVDFDRDWGRLGGQLTVGLGRLPEAGRSEEAVMGEALARFLGLDLGDAITVPVGSTFQRLELVGVFRSDIALWSADVILANESDARVLLQIPQGEVTDLAIWLSTPDEGVVVARKIADRLAGVRIVDRQLMSRTYDLTFDARGGMMGMMLMPALVAFLVLAWDRLTGVGAGERREIGVLKAVGWRTGDLLLARLWENTLVAAGGAGVGILGAYLHVFWAGAPGLAEVLLGWSSLYPALRLAPAVDGAQLLALLCLVGMPFVAASLVPAWRAATMDPQNLLSGAS